MNSTLTLTDCVLADHRSIRELIADFKSEYSSPEGKTNAFRALSLLVESHAKAEEATVLELARGEADLRPHALESLEEHVVTDELVTKIRMTEDFESWEARGKVYCDILEHHLTEEEKDLFPEVEARLTNDASAKLAHKYLQLRGLSLGLANGELDDGQLSLIAGIFNPLYSETGRIGYVVAWLLGVPAWLLFIVFLMRGH